MLHKELTLREKVVDRFVKNKAQRVDVSPHSCGRRDVKEFHLLTLVNPVIKPLTLVVDGSTDHTVR
jgi:hypothetical protein